MNYLTLEEIKKHLNLDSEFIDDDAYLTALAEASEDVVAKYIDYPLVQLEDDDGQLPKALKFAMLLWIGTIYSVRESVTAVNMSTVPHSLELLCDLYRDYTINKSK